MLKATYKDQKSDVCSVKVLTNEPESRKEGGSDTGEAHAMRRSGAWSGSLENKEEEFQKIIAKCLHSSSTGSFGRISGVGTQEVNIHPRGGDGAAD